MIRNVFGKAVTKSTLLSTAEYKNGDTLIRRGELARGALDLKNSQGKNKDDEEDAEMYVERLIDQCAREKNNTTLGWIYNASGAAITLHGSHDWEGRLASLNMYPVRIENGQWGMFVHQQMYGKSSGAVLYQGLNQHKLPYVWCVAWLNRPGAAYGQVHVNIKMGTSGWHEDDWKKVHEALENSSCNLHRAERESLQSVISASPGPQVVFEALLTLPNL